MDVNCVGVFLGMRAVAAPMREAGRGSIVNISSLAGMQSAAGAFAYGTSKWAVRGMTKSAAIELARRGVRVNSIHPGLIETDMLGQLPTDLDRMTRNVPMGRTAAASEVASVALFLASEDSSLLHRRRIHRRWRTVRKLTFGASVHGGCGFVLVRTRSSRPWSLGRRHPWPRMVLTNPNPHPPRSSLRRSIEGSLNARKARVHPLKNEVVAFEFGR